MSKSKNTTEIVNNEKGIALLMVLGVIAILTFLLADFTFETKLNKIKVYNQQDKIQARLNAEAGINFALGKLRLYQEGRNKIEKDENLKNSFPSSDLESVILEPFVFPIPAGSKLNVIQRTAIDEFMKKTLLKGELSITFSKITGFLNPNGLRAIAKTNAPQQDQQVPAGEVGKDGTGTKPEKKEASLIIETKLVETLQRLIKDKNDSDENFHTLYGNLDAAYLVKEIKYYVNDPGKFTGGESGEIEAKFNQKNLTPKHAPMTSIEELYLLPSWDDAIVDLIKDRLSIHEVSMIAVNEITIEDLKIIFPAINNIQIEEFFKYRDGDPDKKIKPTKFKNAEDFKNVITGQLNIVTEAEYTERIKDLESAGLIIDTAGKIYKVNSRGSYNNATFNLVAFVDLPIKPVPPKKSTKPQPPPGYNPDPQDQAERDAQEPAPNPNGKPEKAPPTELLKPRAVEIRVE
jgi:hypothetical protein